MYGSFINSGNRITYDPSNQSFIESFNNINGLRGDMRYDSALPLAASNGAVDLWTRGSVACPIYNGGGTHLYGEDRGVWNAVRFTFDPVTGIFRGIDTAFCGAYNAYKTLGGNWKVYSFYADGNQAQYRMGTWRDTVHYRITIKLKKWCNTYVNGDLRPGGQGAEPIIPWTDRLWRVQNSVFSRIPDLNYSYSNLNRPYGSMGNVDPVNSGPAIFGTPATIPSCSIPVIQGVQSCDLFASSFQIPTYFTNGEFYNAGTPLRNAQYGIDRISTLFAKVSEIYNYSLTGNGNYVASNLVPSGNTSWNLTASGDISTVSGIGVGERPKPPQVHTLGAPYTDRAAQSYNNIENEVPGISIGGATGIITPINPQANSITASIDFFMHADKNQMPIRQISIDVDDGKTPTTTINGYFRNKYGLAPCTGNNCEPTKHCLASSLAPDYGSIVDVTCDNGYYHLSNTYYCNDVNSPNYTTDATACSKFGGEPCCVYRPKVRIQDNWGWCTGNCEPGGGCYNPAWSGNSGINRCDTPVAWIGIPGEDGSLNGGAIVVRYRP